MSMSIGRPTGRDAAPKPRLDIHTNFDFPPIPDRRFDWSAVTGNYEGGDPIGRGASEDEAIADLMAQIEERAG